MLITELKVKNFKSIASASISLSPLTLLVGANASGKSNLVNVFRFISNIVTHGLHNAIALQGGIPFLTNASLPKGSPIEICFTIDLSSKNWIKYTNDKSVCLEIKNIKYEFVIQPNNRGGGYHISSDKMQLSFDCLSVNHGTQRTKRYTPLDTTLSLSFTKRSRKSSIYCECLVEHPDVFDKKTLDAIKDYSTADFFCELCNEPENRNELMLHKIGILLPAFFSVDNFIRIFDFDPKELKKASPIASMRELNENGSNIASVLHDILKNKQSKNKLTLLLKDFLPFIGSVSAENYMDKSYAYKIQEIFNKTAFHSSYLSDGTVSILAIIVALYFEKFAHIIILEEPERNIHPKLLSGILSSAQDVSIDTQVIITTHNPEFLRHAQIEYIKLFKRDNHGFTQITSPSDSDTVKCFIDNELGLDDLFVQDLLGE